MSTVLDPHLLAATRGLSLAARQLAAGALAGLHMSRRTGLAREFSQYRSYQPGDDLRHVDWKLYARSDRFFVRESDVETALTIRVTLDATASMRSADSTGPQAGRPKLDSARLLAAAFAFLAQTQGDQVALHVVNDDKILSVQPGQQRQPFERIIRTLERLEPSGRWPADPRPFHTALLSGSRATADTQTREIVVVLTDGHEQGEEIRASLAPLRARRHELLLLHLVGRDEVDFPFHGPLRFEDLETGALLETDADGARAAFLADQEAHLSEWRRAWEGDGRFQYARFRTDEPLDLALRSYLLRRKQTL